MKTNLYILEPITNLHVGNGDINYNVIDNEVEKDPATNYPIINASGVKGAFRDFIRTKLNNFDTEEKMFGSNPDGKSGNKKGNLKFYGAECLAITMRNEVGKNPYSIVTTKDMLERLMELNSILNIENKIKLNDIDENESYKSSPEDIAVEEIVVKKEFPDTCNIKSLNIDTSKLVMIPHEKFVKISLPIIARNVLKDSISENVWYEEFVPYHSLFYTFVSSENEELLNEFNEQIKDKVIQFGGNATIGYGLTKVTKVGESKNGKK